jgi:hypothetical protein
MGQTSPAAQPAGTVPHAREGQYKSPVGVFGFNPFEGWSRATSPRDVAQGIRRRCDLQAQDVPCLGRIPPADRRRLMVRQR